MANLIEVDNSRLKFLIENARPYSVFDNKANSRRTPGERMIAIALRPLMLAFAWGKDTHWYDYIKLPEAEKYEGLGIKGDPGAFDVYHPASIIRALKFINMSLGGWKQTVLLGPDPERADLEKVAKTGWFYGYRIPGENGEILDAKYSKLLVSGYNSTLALVGPRDFDAIGLEPDTLEEIPIAGVKLFKRNTAIQ